MLKKILFFFVMIFPVVPADICRAQDNYTTAGLLHRNDDGRQRIGKLNIYQDPRIDTLINRYILYNSKIGGIEGFRIQIYSSSDRNAKEESGKVNAEFMNKFPHIKSYLTFERPGYYKLRVGDYRTKMEGTKDLLMVRKVIPDAYLVPDLIHFPDLN